MLMSKYARACAPVPDAHERGPAQSRKTPPPSDDDLPPREVLECLAELEERGMLEPEVLEEIAEIARRHGLRIPRHSE